MPVVIFQGTLKKYHGTLCKSHLRVCGCVCVCVCEWLFESLFKCQGLRELSTSTSSQCVCCVCVCVCVSVCACVCGKERESE